MFRKNEGLLLICLMICMPNLALAGSYSDGVYIPDTYCASNCDSSSSSGSSSYSTSDRLSIFTGEMTLNHLRKITDDDFNPIRFTFNLIFLPITLAFDAPAWTVKGVYYGLYYGGKGLIYAGEGVGDGLVYVGKGIGNGIAYPFTRPAKQVKPNQDPMVVDARRNVQATPPPPVKADSQNTLPANPKTPSLEPVALSMSNNNLSVPSISGLEPVPAVSNAQGGMGNDTHTFGTTSNPSNPDLGSATSPKVPVSSTLEELSSIAKSSQDATKTDKIEDAKGLAVCGFDGKPCRKPDPISFTKSSAQTPGAMELASRIPDAAKKDPEIQNSLAWFDKLEMRKAETQMKIADIQKQIKKGDGDSAVLSAQLATVNNQLDQYAKDQEKVKKDIGTKLKSLKFDLKEEVPPNGASNTAGGSK